MQHAGMRVLLINYEYPPLGGGAGNATANIARELAGLGVEVVVLTSAFGDFPREETVDGYRIHRVATVRRRADRCSVFEMLVFMASAAVGIMGLLRRWRPDLSVAFFGIPSGPVAWLGRVIFGVPFVVALRGGDVPGYQPYDLALYHRFLRPVIVFLWRRSVAVVANSHGLAALARQSAPDLDIRVIPNGVDAVHFSPGTGTGGDAAIRLLLVGRLQHQKGVDVLLEALSGLAERDRIRLLLVGDGPKRAALAEQVKQLGLEAQVDFCGWTDRDRMPSRYRSAEIFVLPSRDEGMPNVVLEAMASGLPVVATRISGSEELVIDGETGFLVPCEDAAALGNRLSVLIRDAALRQRMGRAGRQRIEETFQWRRVADAYRDLAFEQIMKARIRPKV